jgi:hypothetical protein
MVFVTVLVFVTSVVLAVAVAGVLSRRAGLVLAGWLVVTTAVAASGLYADDPWLGVGVAAPLVAGLFALRLPWATTGLTRDRAVALLAAAQTTRLVGAAFLVLLAADRLPPGFALPAGLGDVLVGLLAPFVAYALWRRPSRRALGVAFNALGLLDLVVAIPLGLVHAPGRLQLIFTEPSAELMALLPMALVPTFIVPVAIVLHVASFRLLAVSAPPPRASRPVPAPSGSWNRPRRRWPSARRP